jgi:hypothetical protein
MKTHPLLFPAAAALLAGLIALQTAGPAKAQPRIDPATGMPASGTANTAHFDPTTGLVVPPGATPTDPNGIVIPRNPVAEIHDLIANGQYDDALQGCLTFYNQLKGNQSLTPLLDDWIELGRRYPKARDELVKIRDHGVREFSAGRGYAVLFSEVKAINERLDDEAGTVALFQTIREKDHRLAGQCYPVMEDLLVERGEYALCLGFLGDPQAHFKSLCVAFQRKVALQERQEQIQRTIRQHQEEMAKNANGFAPPVFSSAYPPPNVAVMATNNFVSQVRTLVEIVAGAGDQTTAEKIQREAVALVDDAQLKSAVSDAEQKLHK